MLPLSYILIAAGIISLAAGAPSKSYHSSSHKPKCRTAYAIVYETEYEEIETHECVTKWVPECVEVSENKCETKTREVVSNDNDFDRDL